MLQEQLYKLYKIIHQIWVGSDPIPKRFIERSKRVQNVNSEFTYILWTEDKLICEFPELSEFISLRCVPAFISNIARIKILRKYGGWYIDLDYDVLENVSLSKLVDFKEDLPIILKSDIQGFLYNNGFFYSPKNHTFLYNTYLENYLPHFPMMIEFNKAVLELSQFYSICITDVGKKGTIYREESILSFYKHENFNKFLVEKDNKILLEYNNIMLDNRIKENIEFSKDII